MKLDHIKTPTPELVCEYNQKFESDEDVIASDRAVKKLFTQFPDNSDFDTVLLKVILLNQLYNTRIWAAAALAVARNIHMLNIDEKLRRHELGVVAAIAATQLKGKKWRFYSFASKYCSFHQPEHYPIYDQYVDRLLNAYRREYKFANFKAAHLKDYEVFRETILQFREHFRLHAFSIKELDKFLWAYGSELFGKPLK